MTIKQPFHAELNGDVIELRAVDKVGLERIKLLFAKKDEWTERNKHEYLLHILMELRYQKITEKQVNSVFVLVEASFISTDGRKPDEDEKYERYNDLLELYAPRVPMFTGGTRAVRVSEMNSLEGMVFIQGLIFHLAEECDLPSESQASVIEVMEEWHERRGEMEVDPIDYDDLACTELINEATWREKHIVSDASGMGGAIVRAHIVSRGADAADIEKAWNWMALTPDEHQEQHRIGWDKFLHIYPHLRGRVNRARRLAKKLELEFKAAQAAEIEYSPESLAAEALGEGNND